MWTSTSRLLAAAALALAPGARAAEPALEKAGSLDEGLLVRAVLERNPGLESGRQALRSAEDEAPQVGALDDPTLEVGAAPLSFFRTPIGYSVEIEQMFPLGGKRGLRSDSARAGARAAAADLDGMRQSLALSAIELYGAWYTIHRGLAIQHEHFDLLGDLQASARAQYAAGRASQQDPLQAEVEKARLAEETLILEADRDVVRAELNGLLHRDPGAPLPPPPAVLPAHRANHDARALTEEAVKSRPELAGLRARLGGADAAVALARSSFWPDVGVKVQYQNMLPMPEDHFMVSLSLNVPLQLGRRDAAIDQARAERARLAGDEARQLDEVRVDVARALRRLQQAEEVSALYRTRLVPAARDQVEAARAGFVAGQNPFNALVEAERNLRSVRLDAEKAGADLDLRQAALERAAGRIPGLSGEGATP